MRVHVLALITISVVAFGDDPVNPPGWTSKGKNAQGFVEVTNPKDGSVLIYVPPGEFKTGDDNEARTLPGFWIGKHEITWRQYLAFCTATGRGMPERPAGTGDDHPVVNVDHRDATAYCAWADMKLPGEWEWEKAARGTDGRTFPWGESFDWRKCNSASWWVKREVEDDWDATFFEGYWKPRGHPTLTMTVGSIPGGVSPFGLLDSAGNVWEWCEDLFEPGSSARVNRGGSWLDQASNCRPANRDSNDPATRHTNVGFRPARSLRAAGVTDTAVPAMRDGKPKPPRGTLSVEDIISIAKVASEEQLAKEVREKGIAFDWDDTARAALTKAGLPASVLSAIDRLEGTTVGAGPTGILRVEDLVQMSKVCSEAEVLAKIKQHGLSFQPTMALLDQMKAAGVHAGVLAAITAELGTQTGNAGGMVPGGWTSSGKNAQGFLEVTNPKDGSVLIYVPAGAFRAGDKNEARTLDAFWIAKYEITWHQYGAFCKATSRTMPDRPAGTGDDHPVVNVNHGDATAYCVWAEMKLPTEWQWEKAARGTGGRTFPWGEAFDWRKCNSASWWLKRTVEDDWKAAFFEGYWKAKEMPILTLPVGSIPDDVSPFGVADVAGNVTEWCEDLAEPGSSALVVRGGCWYSRASYCRPMARGRGDPGMRHGVLGFRASRSTP